MISLLARVKRRLFRSRTDIIGSTADIFWDFDDPDQAAWDKAFVRGKVEMLQWDSDEEHATARLHVSGLHSYLPKEPHWTPYLQSRLVLNLRLLSHPEEQDGILYLTAACETLAIIPARMKVPNKHALFCTLAEHKRWERQLHKQLGFA